MAQENAHNGLKSATVNPKKEPPTKSKAAKRKAVKTKPLNGADKKRKSAKRKTASKEAQSKPAKTKTVKGKMPKSISPENSSPKKKKSAKGKLTKAVYHTELERLQVELVKMQEWVKHAGLKVVVIFEGRDAAGKGSVIKRIAECLNPRGCRIVALGKPNDQEKTQWYFQRYVSELPSAGEIVLFDRSWYNRAGVERVMGFCTHNEYTEFMRTCPEFEHMLQRSGIILIKYWFSVSDKEQEKRFQNRIKDPTKRWKLSPMDLEARARWVEYSKAKDDMFAMTDTSNSPWYVVDSDNKKRARLNCISHLLSLIPYKELPYEPIVLPDRQGAIHYRRPPMETQRMVPDLF